MNMGAYLHVQPRLQRCMEVRGWGGDGARWGLAAGAVAALPLRAASCSQTPRSPLLHYRFVSVIFARLHLLQRRPRGAKCSCASSTAGGPPWPPPPPALARCTRRSRWVGACKCGINTTCPPGAFGPASINRVLGAGHCVQPLVGGLSMGTSQTHAPQLPALPANLFPRSAALLVKQPLQADLIAKALDVNF